jgi:unsaturated rhamnogalacturonyl hydrolase
MFVYFMSKMLRLGLVEINTEQVKVAAHNAYQGLLNNKLKRSDDDTLHLSDICKVAGLGGKPYRDGSYEYYVNEPVASDDFKGLGPFILASMEQTRES